MRSMALTFNYNRPCSSPEWRRREPNGSAIRTRRATSSRLTPDAAGKRRAISEGALDLPSNSNLGLRSQNIRQYCASRRHGLLLHTMASARRLVVGVLALAGDKGISANGPHSAIHLTPTRTPLWGHRWRPYRFHQDHAPFGQAPAVGPCPASAPQGRLLAPGQRSLDPATNADLCVDALQAWALTADLAITYFSGSQFAQFAFNPPATGANTLQQVQVSVLEGHAGEWRSRGRCTEFPQVGCDTGLGLSPLVLNLSNETHLPPYLLQQFEAVMQNTVQDGEDPLERSGQTAGWE